MNLENVKLLQGDSLELMRNIPDKSIDLIITDPPYGKKADKGTNGFGSAKNRRYIYEVVSNGKIKADSR